MYKSQVTISLNVYFAVLTCMHGSRVGHDFDITIIYLAMILK